MATVPRVLSSSHVRQQIRVSRGGPSCAGQGKAKSQCFLWSKALSDRAAPVDGSGTAAGSPAGLWYHNSPRTGEFLEFNTDRPQDWGISEV
uniref:Uncharacterized protein n=1 Tax=Serinus canaria TaxID=9135 RepID=A0A8C9NI98_SERCA